MRTVLVVLALVLALVVALLGFDVFSVDSDPHIFGWLGASLACYFASMLVPD